MGEFTPRGGVHSQDHGHMQERGSVDKTLMNSPRLSREIRERVRARHPQRGAAAGVPLADLMPLVHARDAAEGKVAAIGTVNPRARRSRQCADPEREALGRPRTGLACARTGGVQSRHGGLHSGHHRGAERRAIARCVDLAAIAPMWTGEMAALRAEADELKDIRAHWIQWRLGWEAKLDSTEITSCVRLRTCRPPTSTALTLTEANSRDQVKQRLENAEYAFARRTSSRIWIYSSVFGARSRRARLENEAPHSQRIADRFGSAARLSAPAVPPDSGSARTLITPISRERFRGSEDAIRGDSTSTWHASPAGCECSTSAAAGANYWRLMRDAGIVATGIDSSMNSVGLCRAKGLDAERPTFLPILRHLPERSLDGISVRQVVEHLPPARLPEMVRLAGSAPGRAALLVIETPNPECLAIFATHFYLDPTHTRPVPHQLLAFYLEEHGFGLIEIERLSPAIESMPSLAESAGRFPRSSFSAGWITPSYGQASYSNL